MSVVVVAAAVAFRVPWEDVVVGRTTSVGGSWIAVSVVGNDGDDDNLCEGLVAAALPVVFSPRV